MTDDMKMVRDGYTDLGLRTLRGLVGDAVELDRLNKWRGTTWTQAEFDAVINAAIAMRTLSEVRSGC